VKILVFANDLVFAGVTVNAIELAAALRDMHGHEVLLFATQGPMAKLAEQKGLRFLPAPVARLGLHPSPARMRALRRVIRQERPDVIHAWDWYQCLDAYYIEYLLMRVPILVTDMSMSLQRLLPKALPTTFGTPEVVDHATASGHLRASLLLPPVDVHENAPGAVDPEPFRARFALKNSDINLVIVSRLDAIMKAESLFRAINAVAKLGHDMPLRLVIVGDGEVRPEVERLAHETNTQLQRSAIVLTGALIDPRPAYAAADVVIGMGGSALRGMAFGKPTIVVGVQGFSAPFTPETADSFYYRGMYGVGDGTSGNEGLVADIQWMVENRKQFQLLGKFARQFVLKHFALERVALADGLRTATVWARERRFIPPSWDARRLLRFGRFKLPQRVLMMRPKLSESLAVGERPPKKDSL
jgi:L-malate glycosyltransferase